MDVVTTKLQEIQLVVLRWGRFLFGGEGGLVICRWGDLGLGIRSRNGGGECQQSGHIFTFTDGLTDGITSSVHPSVIITVNRHVTVWTCFSNPWVIPSVLLMVHRSRHPYGSGISNPLVIPSVLLTVNRSEHTYKSPVFNPSVILLEKSLAKTSTPATRPFFINSELFVRNSVGNYQRNITVGNYRPNYGRKYDVGDFDRKIPTEIFRRWFRWYLANFW